MKKFSELPAVDFATTLHPSRRVFEEFMEAIGHQRFIFARVQRGAVFAKFQRPGDARTLVRSAEACMPGDLLQIEMIAKCRHGQTPEEIAWMLARGIIAPATQSEFEDAPDWQEQQTQRAAELEQQRLERLDHDARMEQRVSKLERLLTEFMDTVTAAQKAA